MANSQQPDSVPLWPKEDAEVRRMTYLFGEARWYLWLQQQDKQKLSAVRRDLLLLQDNGDLEHIKWKKLASGGSYVTALHQGVMIRGRVMHPHSKSVSDKSRSVSVLDVDEGKVIKLPHNVIRVLPKCAMELPAQAVRCDLGLDCKEQFNWPHELDLMLTRGLQDAVLLVKFISERPGSIPTISAEVSLCNEATGVTVSLQDWLRDYFTPHLELCSLDEYRPVPIGSSVPPINGMSHMAPGVPDVTQLLAQLSLLSMQLPQLQLPFLNQQILQMSQQIPGLTNCALPTVPLPPGFSQPMTPVFPQVSMNSLVSSPPSQEDKSNLPTNESDKGIIPSSSETRVQNVENDVNEPRHPPETIVVDAVNNKKETKTITCPQKFEEPTVSTGSSEMFSSSVSVSSCVDIDLSIASSSDYDDPLGPSALRKARATSVSLKPLDNSSVIRGGSAVNGTAPAQKSQSRRGPDPKEVLAHRVTAAQPDCNKSESKVQAEAPPKASLKDWLEHVVSESDQPCSSASTTNSTSLNAFAKPFVPRDSGAVTLAAAGNEVDIEPENISGKNGTIDTPNTPNGHVVLKEVQRDWKQGTVVSGIVSHVWDPSIFEVNFVDEYSPFLEDLKNEMSDFYSNTYVSIKSKSHARSLVGEYCAYFDEIERMWVRGQVQNWNMEEAESPVVIWAVDYGGLSEVDYHKLQPLVGGLISSVPILATICTMVNVRPRSLSPSNSWPPSHIAEFKKLMVVGKLYYIRIDGAVQDDCWPVSVFTDPECSSESINELLVERGCAFYVHVSPQVLSNIGEPKQETKEEEWDPMKEAYMAAGQDYSMDDEDACVAVSGRKPTEEAGLCWFFQRNGYCYKKLCELRHERLDPDGWAVGEVHTYSSPLVEFEYPDQGERVELKITKIMNVNHFIAQMSRPSVKHKVYRETLPALLEQLNSKETKLSLKTFATEPALGEIVFAEDKTGTLYRGRVIDIDHSGGDKFQVMNVDSGKIEWVNMRHMRQLDTGFLYLPFQAVECLLAGVAPKHTEKDILKTCIAEFADIVRKKKMTATVVQVLPWSVVEVILWDARGQSVAEILEAMGMVKKINSLSMSKILQHPG